jgi:hypothetical protein
LKYRMMWESLKDTAEIMIEDGIVGEVSWCTLLEMMKDGEEMFESGELYNGTALFTIVKALEFGFACLGVLMLVLVFMGRIAYVG